VTVTPGAIDGDQFAYSNSGAPFTLSPGLSGTVNVIMKRTVVGEATGTLHVATNDPEQATIAIGLTGATNPSFGKITCTVGFGIARYQY
jgi:hypothetical protein